MGIGDYEKSKTSVKNENFDFKASCALSLIIAMNPLRDYGSKTVSIT